MGCNYYLCIVVDDKWGKRSIKLCHFSKNSCGWNSRLDLISICEQFLSDLKRLPDSKVEWKKNLQLILDILNDREPMRDTSKLITIDLESFLCEISDYISDKYCIESEYGDVSSFEGILK